MWVAAIKSYIHIYIYIYFGVMSEIKIVRRNKSWLIRDSFAARILRILNPVRGGTTEIDFSSALNLRDHTRAVDVAAYLLQIIPKLNSAERAKSVFRLVVRGSALFFAARGLMVGKESKGLKGRETVLVPMIRKIYPFSPFRPFGRTKASSIALLYIRHFHHFLVLSSSRISL